MAHNSFNVGPRLSVYAFQSGKKRTVRVVPEPDDCHDTRGLVARSELDICRLGHVPWRVANWISILRSSGDRDSNCPRYEKTLLRAIEHWADVSFLHGKYGFLSPTDAPGERICARRVIR